MKITIVRVILEGKETKVTVRFTTDYSGYYLRVGSLDSLISNCYEHVFLLTEQSPEVSFSISEGPVLGKVVMQYRLELKGRKVSIRDEKNTSQQGGYKRRRQVKY